MLLALNAIVQVPFGLGIQLSDNRVAQFDECDVFPLSMNKLLEKKHLRAVSNVVSTPLWYLILVTMLLSISLKMPSKKATYCDSRATVMTGIISTSWLFID